MVRLVTGMLLLINQQQAAAQFQVLYPLTRQVVQRDNNNNGQLYVSGRTPVADLIEAQLTPIANGQGVATGWQPIQTNTNGGLFLGTVIATGGWYTLTVRAIRSGNVVGQAIVQPVGIGEVFITAGQSNARGLGIGDNDLGTATGRVVSIDTINHYQPAGDHPLVSSADPLPVPLFKPLTAGHRVFPMAESSWGWGELGDYIVNRYNVPVAFFSTGWDASTVDNWYSTANGTPACNRYYCNENWQNLQPYTNLKNVLQYYGSTAGVRAVLWHQGEAEYCFPGNCSVTDYATKLTNTIQKSRADMGGRSVPWVVARASFDGTNTNPDVVTQQQTVINTPGLNVFQGPLHDTIINRNAGNQDVHFKNIARPVTHPQYYLNPNSIPANMGLSRFARNWNNSLNNSFFQNAIPITPIQFVATGDPTTVVNPNSTIAIPLATLGTFQNGNQWQIQLLDTLGRYLRTVATSATNPAQIIWPNDLTTGYFKLRAVSTNPVVMGVPTLAFCVGCPLPVSKSDLSLTMRTDQRVISTASPATFTITIQNAGPALATNVVVQDRLPPNMTVTSATGLALSNGVLTGTISRIEVGSTATVSFKAQVSPGTYYNAAEILQADQVDPDSSPGSGTGDGQDDEAMTDLRTREPGGGLYVSPNPNQTPLPTVISSQPTPDPAKADLSLAMWVSSRTPKVNDVVSYSIQVSNAGGLAAQNIALVAYLPTGQQLVLGDDFGLGGSGPTVTLSSLAANTSLVLRFKAKVTASGYAITKAQITQCNTPDPDSTPGNGTDNGEDDTARTDLRAQ